MLTVLPAQLTYQQAAELLVQQLLLTEGMPWTLSPLDRLFLQQIAELLWRAEEEEP